MVPSTLLRSLREAWEVPRDLLLGRYPPFVTGGPLPRGHVPVFVFHSLEPVSFERKLRHLAENGYVTLSGEEYLAVIRRESLAPQRAVLLTFDDGRRSVSTVGEPILARYGMRGVVFLVPGRMAEKATSAAAEEPDATSGQHADGTRSRPETPDEGLLSWQEVLPLVRTGHLSFQSHTLTHARIHTSAALLGFVTPEMRRGYAAFDLPALRSGGRDLLGEEVPLGSPVFESLPRLAETLRFFEDEAARQRCHDVVAQAGAEPFFRRRGWRRSLLRALRQSPHRGHWESVQERAEAHRRELRESRRLIEERVGQPVELLCFPWHTHGPTARAAARDAGYRVHFCGKLRGTPITLPGGDPERIARVSEDYVELLPGRGRRTLGSVLRVKWARRFSRRA